jgi:hypothetical protein
LHAIAAEEGGHVALVIGAGTSFEAPTSLPLGRQASEAAHAQLLKNGAIEPGECPNPADLAALASVIYAKENSQQPLVAELPMKRFRLARPNRGYKLLIAMMAEGAITYVLSLNFDLAVQNAASELGCAVNEVKSFNQPVPATATIIHLHGNAYDEPDDLVLRTEVINEAWKTSWQQIIAQQVLAAPNVLFIGLGSPAPVLTETVQMIVDAVGHGDTFYQADIMAHDQSGFAAQLGVPADRYVQGTWNEVMGDLAARVAREHVDDLVQSCTEALTVNGASEDEIQHFQATAQRLRNVTLLGLGRLRSRAKLDMEATYVPRRLLDDDLLAEPVSALAEFCQSKGCSAIPCENGVWNIMREGHSIGSLIISTGRGTRKLSALEAQIKYHHQELCETSIEPPQAILLGGIVAEAHEIASPEDIVTGDAKQNLITGPALPRAVVANDANAMETLAEIFDAA